MQHSELAEAGAHWSRKANSQEGWTDPRPPSSTTPSKCRLNSPSIWWGESLSLSSHLALSVLPALLSLIRQFSIMQFSKVTIMWPTCKKTCWSYAKKCRGKTKVMRKPTHRHQPLLMPDGGVYCRDVFIPQLGISSGQTSWFLFSRWPDREMFCLLLPSIPLS